MNNNLLKIEEVAVVLGVSVKTLNNWYAYKKQCPEEKLSKILPDFIQCGVRQTRFWKKEDLWKIIEFQKRIPKGRNGVLGCVTQKYYKKEKDYEKES